MKTTVIIPTFNEAENLPKLVSALFSLPLTDLSILVVDDNSPDGTGTMAEEFKLAHPGRVDVLHRAGKMGLGTAYLEGFKKAMADGAEALLQMDCDFSHPPEKIPEMVANLPGYDCIIGSRYIQGGSVDMNWPLWRKGLSAWGNFYARTILGLKNRDVTGGFRLWKRETLLAMPLNRIRSNGYVFQVELCYVATRLGLRFNEVPIYFADRRWGKSKMNRRIMLEAALRVWQLRGMYGDLNNSGGSAS